jgi:hypothetical protein
MKAYDAPLEEFMHREDDLEQIEISIAQRADELSLHAGSERGTDLIHWMQAEREVLHRYLGFASAGAGFQTALVATD